MSAADLSDVYKYGVRFIGYLVAVTLVGGIIVAAGVGVGFSALFSADPTAATDPARLLAQISFTNIVIGVVIIAVGVVVSLTGLVGLLYKLIADATMTGAANAMESELPDVVPEEDVSADGEDDDTSAEPAADEPPEPVPAEEPPGEGGTTEPTPVEKPPEDIEPVGGPSASEEDPEPADEPAEDSESPDQTPIDEALGEGGEPASDDGDGAATEQAEAREPNDGDRISDSDASSDGRAEPREWSPPDPSEFDGDEDDGPRTADDLFGEEGDRATDEESSEDVADLFDDSEEDDGATSAGDNAGEDPLSDTFE